MYVCIIFMHVSIYLSIYPGFSPRGVQPRASDHLQLCHQNGAEVQGVQEKLRLFIFFLAILRPLARTSTGLPLVVQEYTANTQHCDLLRG